HAEEDKKRRELVEARNNADSLIYSTEKSLNELGDKVDAETKQRVEEIIGRLRKAMEGDDKAEINKISEELQQASHKLAETMYQQASQAGGEQAAGGQQGGADQSGQDEDVVDADYEEVDENKK
ncbi:MAG: Hsp70 family protein, partial [bacterium]